MFSAFTATGIGRDDDRTLEVGTMLWCTCFRPDLAHLRTPNLTLDGAVPATTGDLPAGSVDRHGMYFLGYGDWFGPASTTLIGVGACARATSTARRGLPPAHPRNPATTRRKVNRRERLLPLILDSHT